MIKETTVSNFIELIRREKQKQDSKAPQNTLTKVQTEKQCLAPTKKSTKPKKLKVDSELKHLPHDSLPVDEEGHLPQLDEAKTSMYQIYFRSLERKHYQKILEGSEVSKVEKSVLNNRILEIEKTLYVPNNRYRNWNGLRKDKKEDRKSMDMKPSKEQKLIALQRKLQPNELLIGTMNSSLKMPKITYNHLAQKPTKMKRKHNFSLEEGQFEIRKKLKMQNHPHKIEGWQEDNYDDMLRSFHV